jgi:hypothetical protein
MMAWGNEKHMRPVIAARRAENRRLRAEGKKWREIAEILGYGSPYHAHIDWTRYDKNACVPPDSCITKRGRGPITSRAPHDATTAKELRQ